MRFLPLILWLILALAACDDSFDPLTQDKTDFFAVFGFLDTAADTQFVRLSPVRETLEAPADVAAAQVSTTHLATSTQVVWQDSLVVLDDGQPGRLFFAQIPVEPGDVYRMEIRGADGEVTQAVTQVPPRIRIAPGPIRPGFNQRWTQWVTLLDQSFLPYRVNLLYEVTPPGADEPVTLTDFFIGEAQGAGGVQVVVNLEFHREEILTRLRLPQIDSTVVLNSIRLDIEQLSDEWGQDDTPERPGPVENGFGFFGSVARYSVSWTLDEAGLKLIGYKAPE